MWAKTSTKIDASTSTPSGRTRELASEISAPWLRRTPSAFARAWRIVPSALEHPITAVYLVPLIPVTSLDPYMPAPYGPGGRRGHLSRIGLGLYELGDVNSSKDLSVRS